MVPVHESRILCDRLSPGARVPGKHLNMHSAPLQASPPSATTFLSPKVNQTQPDNSNRPTTTSTPSSNPHAPIHTTPITNATHTSPHTQQGHIRPAPAPCRTLPRLPSRTQREREREKTSNNEPPTANRPTRPDPIQPIGGFPPPRPAPPSTASRHHHHHHVSHEPGMARRRPWCAAYTGPGVMHRAGPGRLLEWGEEGNTIDDAIPRERWSRHTHIPSSRPAFQARLSSSSSMSPSRDPSHHPPSIDRPTLSSPVTHRGRTAHVSPHPSRSRLSPTAVSLVVCSRVSPTTRTTSHPPV